MPLIPGIDGVQVQFELLGRMLEAAVLGGVVGFQREHVGRAAGVRTYACVCLGSCLFGMISARFGDPGRISSQVVTGIGFLGAGVILKEQGQVIGLTTAASLWAIAAIGLAAAYDAHWVAVGGAAIILGLLALPLHRWEQQARDKKSAGRALDLD